MSTGSFFKRCKSCNRDLPLDSFYLDSKPSGIRKSKCKGCLSRKNAVRDKTLASLRTENKTMALEIQSLNQTIVNLTERLGRLELRIFPPPSIPRPFQPTPVIGSRDRYSS